MDRRVPYTARPVAGASWFLLARLAVLLQGLLPLLWFLGWFSMDGMNWDLAGFGVGLDVLVQWIQRSYWKENQWRRFTGLYNTLGGALAAPHYHQHFIQALTHRHSTLITWIAACVYFAWSPDLACAGLLVVCGVIGWITIFIHAPYLRASSGAHREGLIQTFDIEKLAYELDSHTLYPLLGFTQLAGGADNKQHLFIGTDVLHADGAGVDSLKPMRTAPFRIPRPWEADAPALTTDRSEHLLDFLDRVDMIIELGHVADEQERKNLLTSYLPITKRLLWRGLKVYDATHSYADFRKEILHLHPEIGARESGSLAGLEKLCAEFDGVGKNEEGRIRWFGIRFRSLVQKLQRPPVLVTNRDACTKYLRTLDSVFAHRVCRAVEEREIARVMLQQLGVALKVEEGHAQRKEDVILLRELVGIAEAIARTDVSYLHGDGANKALGDIPAPEPHHAPRNNSLEVFTQISDGAVTVAKEVMDLEMAQPCWKTEDVGEKPVETALAEISALTERMRTLETSVREELQEVSMWCRDQFNGLWEETAVMGDELGIVQDELRTIQRRLKGITVAATTRNEETHLEMDMLERRMHEIEDSSSQGFRDIFDTERDTVDVLRTNMLNELGMLQDELRTIQTRLRQRNMDASFPQAEIDSDQTFLLNWMKEETSGGGGRAAARNYKPLLTKKQKAAMARLQQPLSNHRAHRKRRGSGGSQNDEITAQDSGC
ncbi:hypothetical protein DFH08DRAFT_331044 [Mycena albidolilacea]|uniref:Uncharacterized protein n=1 Tax=Mycena albidolilacea TaxID=1033008 RepID=A0AAD7EJR5_9AGAR|nr:hypothetical protein DFH08DRAFT_331044 [Mycena albidolilacea]